MPPSPKLSPDSNATKSILTNTSLPLFISFLLLLSLPVYITFNMEPEHTTVYQGHTAILHCQATGDPQPFIQWKKKDKFLEPRKSR